MTETATDCQQRVSGEDAAFHGLSAGRFTFIIRDLFAPCQIGLFGESQPQRFTAARMPLGTRVALARPPLGIDAVIDEVLCCLFIVCDLSRNVWG